MEADVGGVGIAMLLLVFLADYLRKTGRLNQASQQGIVFWSSIYIPVVVAMAARQNVLAAVKGGPAAVLAGVLAVGGFRLTSSSPAAIGSRPLRLRTRCDCTRPSRSARWWRSLWWPRGELLLLLGSLSGEALDLPSLQTWARGRLSKYKIPRLLKTASELPRNAMGKVAKPVVRTLFQ